jgi:glycosyltransferase involved in cell wall biosynthesis
MKIAQISPPIERTPPHLYGGTERIVSYLTEQLVADGHEVTLFASGDSVTKAELVPCCSRALRLDKDVIDFTPYLVTQLEQVRQRAHLFDVVHFHTDLLHYPLSREIGKRAITTLHGRLDFPALAPFFEFFGESQVISISNSQRSPLPRLNYLATIQHGLPEDLLRFSPTAHGGYLAFLGRICPEKRPDRAIEIAKRADLPLLIAAKVDRVDETYWTDKIEPLVQANPNVKYIGEIDERQKENFLGDALALLSPIDHPEPFGLVMIEAMACGTPAIAFRRGSVEEVLEDGVSGFIVETVDEAVEAVRNAAALDRSVVRNAFIQRFSAKRMAQQYEEIYSWLAQKARW